MSRMLKKLLVAGAIEAILLTAAALLRPQFLVEHAPWVFLAAAIILVLVAWYEPAKKETGPSEGWGNSAATIGPDSPAIAGNQFHGPATLNFGTPPQEKAKPNSRGRAHIEARNKCPPMPISEALRYLMAIGYSKEQARLNLQQAFSDGSVIVWGRPEVPATTMKAPRVPQEIWKLVPPHYWDEFKLVDEAFSVKETLPHTDAQPHVMKNLFRKYWSLRVSETEIRLEWPPPRSEDDPDDGVTWRTV